MTNQFLHHELFIGQTHDAFVLEAKSISAAREEAKGILREYFIGKNPAPNYIYREIFQYQRVHQPV